MVTQAGRGSARETVPQLPPKTTKPNSVWRALRTYFLWRVNITYILPYERRSGRSTVYSQGKRGSSKDACSASTERRSCRSRAMLAWAGLGLGKE